MVMDNVIQVVKPAPDSHFLLLNCGCGSDNVAYVEKAEGMWAVKCFDCGKELLDQGGWCRHGIQVAWNGGGRYG